MQELTTTKMAKSLNQNKQNSQSMLGQKTGSMLDKKTNEDFNNEHPNHSDSGLIVDGSTPDATKTKQIPDKKKSEIKLKKNKQ